ncbi:hypothetical protein NPT74_004584 [Salmonella enterica subsp. enterica serovar Techimani]|nr:hypothetical protein [Salmonella enterica]EJN2870971.1 hypothetical protein [Salmonella enterica subsp. enterica serovar Techimani]EJN2805505.1 hypothetical protein [Salmonella enterica]EJN3654811.1 hypothetical protein [Salmonella enterica subsp. enterica serovar Techimani]EJN3668384.1 hypothetical protein [Salmonella enterica subsp. enterica serovar Techimani]
MSTPVFMKFRDWLVDSGLADGYIIQLARWLEKPADGGEAKYIIFQPDGGTPRLDDLSADDNVQVVLVSAKNDPQPAIQRAQDILDYVTANPDSDCLNAVFNMGGIPVPAGTEEGRTVIRLLFRCTS